MKQKFPKISIIVPVYNVEQYITECLQSVMRQTYKGEIECILVDDCGTDRSIEVAEQIFEGYTIENQKSKIDNPISFHILHHEHNRGLSAARNTGTDAATGDYIFYLDSDDFIEPKTIEMLYNAFSLHHNIAFTSILPYTYPKRGVKAFVENWKHIDNKIKIIKPSSFNLTFLKLEVCFTAWGKLFPKWLIKDIRFLEGRNNEDTRFFYDLAPIIEKKQLYVIELPDELYAYRVNNSGICSNADKLLLAHLYNLIDIRKETQDEEVRRFVAEKAFMIELSYINSHEINNQNIWVDVDLKTYSLGDVWSYSHSIIKCLKYLFLKKRNHTD